MRHDFESRNDGALEHAQLRRHGDFVQNAIDPVPNAQIIFERLDVNIGGALDNRFTDDLVDEFDDRSFRIVGSWRNGRGTKTTFCRRSSSRVAEAQSRIAAVPEVRALINANHNNATIKYALSAIDGDNELVLIADREP